MQRQIRNNEHLCFYFLQHIMNRFIWHVILDLRMSRSICPEFNRIEKAGQPRLEEVLRFKKLGTCSDRMTKATKVWNSAGMNHFGVALS